MRNETLSRETAIHKCTQLAVLVDRYTNSKGNGLHATAIDSLRFLRESDTSRAMRSVSEPILAIVVQGRKEVLLNEETYPYGVAQYLVVSVDLPLCGFARSAVSIPECLVRHLLEILTVYGLPKPTVAFPGFWALVQLW